MIHEKKSHKLTYVIVISIILVLGAVSYFLVGPKITGFVVEKQIIAYNQGIVDTVNKVVADLNEYGYTKVVLEGGEIFLAPVQLAQDQPAQ